MLPSLKLACRTSVNLSNIATNWWNSVWRLTESSEKQIRFYFDAGAARFEEIQRNSIL